MKKQIVIPLCCVLSVAIIGGSVYGVMKYNASKTVIDVLPVSSLSTQYWENSFSEGYVTSNVSQQIALEENQVIQKIYVNEGDTVSIGDKLVAFDTTLSELDLEDKRISIQKIDLQIEDIKKQIQQIKENKEPVDTGMTPNTFETKEQSLSDSGIVKSGIKVIENPSDTADTSAPETDSTSGETTAPENPPESQLDFDTEAKPIDDAYEIMCDENTIITPAFINKIRGCDENGENQKPENAMTVILKIADSGTGITLHGNLLKAPTAEEIPTRLAQFMRNNRKMNTYPTDGELNEKTDILEISGKNYVYCSPDMTITAAFIKKLLAMPPAEGSEGQEALTVILKMKDHADFTLDGNKLTAPDESRIDTTTLADYMKNGDFNKLPDETEPPETPDSETDETDETGDDFPNGGGDDFPNGGGDDFPNGGDDIPSGPVYTPEDIKQLVTEKEQEIAKLQTNRKQAELDITKLQKEIDAAVVTSSVNGIVKTAVDPTAENSGIEKGAPFIVVQSEEGLYLTGTINELQLEKTEIGQQIMADSYMSGISFTAEITEISDYPTGNQMGYSENQNVSYYPFKAYIENAEGLKNGEYVSLSMNNTSPDGFSDNLFILKAYIRQDDDGSSYVYMRDENQRLKKQPVVTGRSIYGSYIEIKNGITMEDYLAFPYGKTLKDGVKTKEGSMDSIIY